MLRIILFTLVSTVLAPTLATQVPLGSGHHWLAEPNLGSLVTGNEDTAAWNLDVPPSPDATDHLVFETVHSLLQHWPNTRMRNGHNIVPGTIPKGTLLYHGKGNGELPTGPEWVAVDPEHSYYFCWTKCSYLTMAATQPLKVVYFDGTSAAKLDNGPADTQQLIAWGRLTTTDMDHEQLLVEALCRWGKLFGVDGFNGNGFVSKCLTPDSALAKCFSEVVLCDFTSGISIVSSVNLPSSVRGMETPSMFETLNVGSLHNHFPGETRIRLDLAGLVSFYDTQLAPSLVPIRAGQERWDHRVGNISEEDLSAVKTRLEASLIRYRGLSSGIDWRTLFRVIVDRYAQRLELTRYLLNSSSTKPDEIIDLANKTQSQLRVMLTPYLVLSSTPTDPSDATNLDWTIPVYQLCATTHIHPIESELDSMTDGERLLLQAVRGTNREICRVVTKMWATGVYAGVDPLLNTKESIDIAELTSLRSTWEDDLNGLMVWLDWSVWVKCDPGCGPEEMCYLPTWPVGFPEGWTTHPFPSKRPDSVSLTNFGLRAMAKERFTEEMQNTIQSEWEDWIRPQPRCIKRFDPFGHNDLLMER